MKVVELVKISIESLKMMSKHDIKLNDWKHVEMFDEYLNMRKNNDDFKLYDDENGTNAKMMDTGRVEVIGNFVVYAVTQNTDVSILRAQKYVQDNPNCTSYELYKAIVKELF